MTFTNNLDYEDAAENTTEKELDTEITAGDGCTECSCNYFRPDLDEDLTGFTCICGHMKSSHWR